MFQLKKLAMGLFLIQSFMVSVDGLQLMKVQAGAAQRVERAMFFDLDETLIFQNDVHSIFQHFPDYPLANTKLDDAFFSTFDRANMVSVLPELICLDNTDGIAEDDLLFTTKWVILTLIDLRKAGVDIYIISRGQNAEKSKKLFDIATQIAGIDVRPVGQVFNIENRKKGGNYNKKPEIVSPAGWVTEESYVAARSEMESKIPASIWERKDNVGAGNGCENEDAQENGYYKHDVIKSIIAHNGYTQTGFADDDENNRAWVVKTSAAGEVYSPSFTVWDFAYEAQESNTAWTKNRAQIPRGPAVYLQNHPRATAEDLRRNVYAYARDWMGAWAYQRSLGQTEFRAITNLFPAVPVRAAVAVPADRGAAAPADFVPNAAAVQRLVTNMGFSEGEVVLALRNCNNDVPTAVQWILDNPEEAPAALATPATVAPPATVTVTTSVEELMDNGFTREQVNQVLRQVENCTLTDARAWLARQQQEPVLPPHSPVGENPTPADIPAARTGGDAPTPAPRDAVDVPVSVPAVPVVDLQTVAAIVEMGYEETQVRDALQQCNNNREAAVEMLRGAAESAPVSSPAGVNPAPAPRQVSTPRQGVISAPAPRRRRVAHRPIARRTGSADPSDPATSTAAPGRRPSSHSAGGDVAAQVAGNVTSDPASGTSVAATCAHTRGRAAVTSEQRAAGRWNSVPDFASDTPMCDGCCSL